MLISECLTLVLDAHSPKGIIMENRVFILQPYARKGEPFYCVIITPEDTPDDVVTAAWSYAVRYTAKGLDLPDHEAALQLMLERHSSWQAINAAPRNIPVNLQKADDDVPEKA